MKPYAIIVSNGSRYVRPHLQPPERWQIVKPSRETPQRLYTHPEKSRWSDPYWTKDREVVGQYDTFEEAQAVLDAAKALCAPYDERVAAGWRESREAQTRANDAANERQEALRRFWEARS